MRILTLLLLFAFVSCVAPPVQSGSIVSNCHLDKMAQIDAEWQALTISVSANPNCSQRAALLYAKDHTVVILTESPEIASVWYYFTCYGHERVTVIHYDGAEHKILGQEHAKVCG